jgi:ankyrin repeat protein
MTKGAEVDKRDSSGRTPLHLAALYGGTHMVRVMMLSGAKKSIWDDEGKTAFDHAVRGGKKATIEALLVFRAPSMSSKQSIDFRKPRAQAAK